MASLSSSKPTGRTLIRRAFVSAALNLITAGIAQLHADHAVHQDLSENSISQLLYLAMERIHQGTDSDIVNFALQPNRPTPMGHMIQATEPDFTFHYDVIPRDNRYYLAVEAKLLRGSEATLARLYVVSGVMRFVQGKYSTGHDHAVMLGYVVTPTLENAIDRVRAQMNSRFNETAQRSEFADASTVWKLPHIYTSRHLQMPDSAILTLLHCFADFT